MVDSQGLGVKETEKHWGVAHGMIEALCHLTSTPPRKEAGGTLFASRLPNRSKDWGMNLLVTAGICTLSAGSELLLLLPSS